MALPLLALERRLKTAVLLSGGLPFEGAPPETEPLNFAPRITLPVLMVNGRYDPFFTVETAQEPLYKLLGTPLEDKSHHALEGGHASLPRAEVVRLSLDMLGKAHLLERATTGKATLTRWSRRDLLRAAGLVPAALMISLSLPTAARAQSGGEGGEGG